MKTKEARLKKFLLERLSLNKNRINRHHGETPVHLRFMNECGINTFPELKEKLSLLDLEYTEADYKYFSRSPDYGSQGLLLNFNDEIVGLQFNVPIEGRIKRKILSPKSLGIEGDTFTNREILRGRIINGLDNFEFADCLISMLDNIDNKTPIRGLENVARQDVNRITSDFGEILGAYIAVGNGTTIYFPSNSNHNIADYYENDQPVSAKGRKAGGKVNLNSYKTLIDQTTTTGKFLYSLAEHNKDNFFKYAAKLCLEVNNIAKMVGGTTVIEVEQFVRETSYDDFYNYISNTPEHKGLGLPNKGRPRELWNQGSTDPFYFTVNTLISRLWGGSNVDKISEVVVKFLKEPKFITIDIVNNNVVSNEIEFSDVSDWKTVYWGRATKAWHNWMAVEPKSRIS